MNLRTIVFVFAAFGSVLYALTAPNASGFTNARILYLHLPCAFLTIGLICHAGWLGFQYLQKRDSRFDARNTAAIELTLLFAILTMGSGILFSAQEWGKWWNNDPRQTSFLVVLLLAAAGVALRSGISDEQKAARSAAAYSVATFLPNLFCLLALPRLLESLHPSTTIVKGELDGRYWLGIAFVLLVMIAAARTMYMDRVRKLETREEDLAAKDTSEPVRPVAVAGRDEP